MGESLKAGAENGQTGDAAPELHRPIANAYVVPGTRLVAGEYPGSPPTAKRTDAEEKLAGFLRAGVTAFVDLTDAADGLAPYEPILREAAARLGGERELRAADDPRHAHLRTGAHAPRA